MMSELIELYNKWMIEGTYYAHLLPADQSITKSLVGRLEIKRFGENQSVLDLGSGRGFTCALIRDANPSVGLIAVDPSAQMLEKLKVHRALRIGEFINCKAEDLLPNCKNRPTVILSSFALHHVPHDKKLSVLKQIYELLPSGGKLGIGEISANTNNADRLWQFDDLVSFYAVSAKYIAKATNSIENGKQELRFMAEALEGKHEHFLHAEQWIGLFRKAGLDVSKPFFSEPLNLKYFNLVGYKS